MEQDKIFIDIDNLPKKLSSSETQELFIPIAERIGVRKLRTELQNLTLEAYRQSTL